MAQYRAAEFGSAKKCGGFEQGEIRLSEGEKCHRSHSPQARSPGVWPKPPMKNGHEFLDNRIRRLPIYCELIPTDDRVSPRLHEDDRGSVWAARDGSQDFIGCMAVEVNKQKWSPTAGVFKEHSEE